MAMDPMYRKDLVNRVSRMNSKERQHRELDKASGWDWIERQERTKREKERLRSSGRSTSSTLRDPALQKLSMENAVFDPSRTKEIEDRLSNPGIAADTLRFDRHHTNNVSPTGLPLRLADLEAHPTALEFAMKRENLPSTKSRKEILHLLKTNQVVLITGEPGSGKTTQIPQYILDDWIYQKRTNPDDCKSNVSIICTQPRRISAISVAERVASERMETVGDTVGWKIRHESALDPSKCRLLFCTTGLMVQRMRSDQELKGVTHLIVDEVHERSLEVDVLLIYIKELIQKRKDVKVLLMSATVNAEIFTKYFDNCASVHIPGLHHPVEIQYVEDIAKDPDWTDAELAPVLMASSGKGTASRDVQEFMKFTTQLVKSSSTMPRKLSERLAAVGDPKTTSAMIVALTSFLHRMHPMEGEMPGAILVFLPGWDSIQRAKRAFLRHAPETAFDIRVLHSRVPNEEQRRAFERPASGRRKVVLSTNIAETSVTIEDVVFVIDSGLQNSLGYEVRSNLPSLQPDWISQANARQRTGRAGRTGPGKCFRLYSKHQFDTFEEYGLPEIMRSPLENVLLNILSDVDSKSCSEFLANALSPPKPSAIAASLNMLRRIGAVQPGVEQLTPLGWRLSQLPIEPKLGKMILHGCILGCGNSVLTLASCLGVGRDVWNPGQATTSQERHRLLLAGKEQNSDHLLLLNLVREWNSMKPTTENIAFFALKYGVQLSVLRKIGQLRLQLKSYVGLCGMADSLRPDLCSEDSNDELIQAIAAGCLFPSIARADVEESHRGGHCRGPIVSRKEMQVALSGSCVARGSPKPFDQHWLAYSDKVKIEDRVYLCGVAPANPQALVVFSDRLYFASHANPRFLVRQNHPLENSVLQVDDWLSFLVLSEDEARLIGKLRRLYRRVSDEAFRQGLTDHVKEAIPLVREQLVPFLCDRKPYSVDSRKPSLVIQGRKRCAAGTAARKVDLDLEEEILEIEPEQATEKESFRTVWG
ncbi:hypothetical protein NDN08_003602 [Rhodosorus marinus]|uniref:Uncharacterized protein n=1 Tax=Rhodosorus marinus TaxID=101924 RepID=A0AAV8UY09_9RHOD|nr:hypothetical protein NDN08_003602 [Rhodosorus marinus]